MNRLISLLLVSVALGSQAVGRPAPRRMAWRVVPEASHIWIVTHRSGLLSFLGHEHAIVPSEWRTRLCLSDPLAAGDEATLVVSTSSLVIDSDSARALAGLSGGPGGDDRREIQRKMLDSGHLDADRFPEARLEARVDSVDGRKLLLSCSLTLHGVRREVRFPVLSEGEGGGRLHLSGTLRIRQRAYEMKPESIKGVVKVSDEVDLHFSIAAVPSGAICTSISES